MKSIRHPFQTGSTYITDEVLIQNFINDPQQTFLVSFPRTGSHWLRMLCELYFKRPSLTRVFYYPDNHNYLMLHTHDIKLDTYRKNVIYLYRHPVATIFSQLMYYQESFDDVERIRYWTNLYGCHLSKWLFKETFSEKKTILRYENLQHNLANEFMKVTRHFGEPFEKGDLLRIAKKVSKKEVRKKTVHDPQVIRLDDSYERTRKFFQQKYSTMILDLVFQKNIYLQTYFL